LSDGHEHLSVAKCEEPLGSGQDEVEGLSGAEVPKELSNIS